LTAIRAKFLSPGIPILCATSFAGRALCGSGDDRNNWHLGSGTGRAVSAIAGEMKAIEINTAATYFAGISLSHLARICWHKTAIAEPSNAATRILSSYVWRIAVRPNKFRKEVQLFNIDWKNFPSYGSNNVCVSIQI
jgi:hypothetical protein